MSNIAAREAWRAHSIISPAVKATIQGLGWRSYTAGLRALVEIIQPAADDTLVFPGHGSVTTTGREKRMNPYVGVDA